MTKKQVKSKSKVTKVKFETPEVELRFKTGKDTQIPKEECLKCRKHVKNCRGSQLWGVSDKGI